MNNKKKRAIIVGAGIGGLAAAIALDRAGRDDAIVLEQSPDLKAVGAGLTIQGNALSALGEIDTGLVESIRNTGQTIQTAQVTDRLGRILSEIPIGKINKKAGLPAPVTIHRATLQRQLLGACGNDRVITGARCTGVETNSDGVTATFEDHMEREVRGDVLIGADGIHSAVRAALLGKKEPRYAGYTCWRGVTLNQGLWPMDMVAEHWGAGERFGIVPIDGNRIYWFAVSAESQGAGLGDAIKEKELVLSIFARWREPIRALIKDTPSSAILRNDIIDRPPVRTWGREGVTLLGDAAHPMTPNLGQGACMAIEDAAILGRMFKEVQEPEQALRSYEALRIKRTGKLVQMSRRLGAIAQWSHPVARAVRDAQMQLMPGFMTARVTRKSQTFQT